MVIKFYSKLIILLGILIINLTLTNALQENYSEGFYSVYQDSLTPGWIPEFLGSNIDYNNQEQVYNGSRSIKANQMIYFDLFFINGSINASEYSTFKYAAYINSTNNSGDLFTTLWGTNFYKVSTNTLQPGWNIIEIEIPRQVINAEIREIYIENTPGRNEILYFDEFLFLEKDPSEENILPEVSISHFPKSINYSTNVTFTATANDASGINNIKIFIDNINVQTCNSITTCTYTNGNYFPATSHTYYSTATDNIGNIGRDPQEGVKDFEVEDISPIRDYSDVLVVINSNSKISEKVGKYFAKSRNIPKNNIVYVNTPTTEEIDTATFESLRYQIQNHITKNLLYNKINYIVTTKGVPFKVRPTGDSCFSLTSSCASVESELSLILGPYSSFIGNSGNVLSPYAYRNSHFSRDYYGIYLVTRLDGYNFEQIKAMINKASAPRYLSSSNKFIFDQDPDWNPTLAYLNLRMQSSHDILTNKGYNSVSDSTTTFITNQTDVIGYVSWGSNDHYDHLYTENAKPHNKWQPGAIADTYVSTSARTFNFPPTYGQSLISDLIEEGVSGAKGYVYEPYSTGMTDVIVLFDRYSDGYNLAESFYMSSEQLSWMGVVVGDPKLFLVASNQSLSYRKHLKERIKHEKIDPPVNLQPQRL